MNHFKCVRCDGRIPTTERSLTILIGSKGGFCDLTKGKTRVIIFTFISPSMVTKRILFSKICFSFRFFYKNLIKSRFSFFQKKAKNLLFLSNLVLPLRDFLKNLCLLKEQFKIPAFKPRLEFKIGIIENDGNLQDIINVGIGIAIKSLETPLLKFYGQIGILKWDMIEIKFSNEKEIFVLSNTFSIQEIFEGGSLVLLDPTYFEELHCNSFLSMLMLKQGVIKNLNHGYENELTEENLLYIYKLSLRNFCFFGKLTKKILNHKLIVPSNLEIITIT
jgi:hypothetical protein